MIFLRDKLLPTDHNNLLITDSSATNLCLLDRLTLANIRSEFSE